MAYKIVNGTSYYVDTPDTVINILEKYRQNREKIELDYGFTERCLVPGSVNDISATPEKLGQSWGETSDIVGYVGRSTGAIKVPLLLHNSRSMGGPCILTDAIVRIRTAKGKRVLYCHPSYKPCQD